MWDSTDLKAKTQKEYMKEGMNSLIWVLCRTMSIPVGPRATLWRFVNKTLPIYHPDKEEKPLLESTNPYFLRTKEYTDWENTY